MVKEKKICPKCNKRNLEPTLGCCWTCYGGKLEIAEKTAPPQKKEKISYRELKTLAKSKLKNMKGEFTVKDFQDNNMSTREKDQLSRVLLDLRNAKEIDYVGKKTCLIKTRNRYGDITRMSPLNVYKTHTPEKPVKKTPIRIKNKIQDLTKDNKQLNSLIVALRRENSQIPDLTSENYQLKRKIGELKKEVKFTDKFKATKEKRISQLNKDLNETLNLLSISNDELNRIRKFNDKLLNENYSLNQKVAEKDNQIEQLKIGFSKFTEIYPVSQDKTVVDKLKSLFKG